MPGGRSDCVIRAPIPYTLRFTRDRAGRASPAELVEAVVDGDLVGPARLEVDAAEDGPGVGGAARLGDGAAAARCCGRRPASAAR